MLKVIIPFLPSPTVCKSCLVKHLEERNTCPTCEIVIHQSHPLNYIAFDRTMQDIVCKLVPMLQEGESKGATLACYLRVMNLLWYAI